MASPASAAKRLGRQVLIVAGKKVVKGKVPQESLKFLSQSRPLITGTAREVATFTRQELVDGVGAIGRSGLGGMEVDFASWATPADAVMSVAGLQDPGQFLGSAVGDLVDESARLDPTRPLAALLGEDWLGSSNPIMLSAPERMQRLGEGLVTAIGQAHVNNIDPFELFDPPLLRYTLRYLRSHIMRNGFDHGNYSELVRAATLSRLPLRLPARHQIAIPQLMAPFSLNTGYDTILANADWTVAHQNKAVEFAKVAMGGTVSPRKMGTSWYVPREPVVLAQRVSDGIRNRPWSHQLPGSGITGPLPTKVALGTPGWDPVSPVSVFSLDGPYLIGNVLERTDDAMWRAGTRVASISSFDLPAPVKTQLRAIVGGPTIAWDMPREELERLTTDWLDALVPTMQDGLNSKLGVRKLRDAIKHPGGPPELRLYASHQVDRMMEIFNELELLL
jgi:hypothetical protein